MRLAIAAFAVLATAASRTGCETQPGDPPSPPPASVCEGKACGDACNPCAPAECMSPVAFVCDLAHQCGSNAAGLCDPAPGDCTLDGKTYRNGDTLPSPDGCNTCSCMNGQIACTLIACPPPATWYYTCGAPVCFGWTADPSVPLCTTQRQGDPCTILGERCDPKSDCNERLVCATNDPTGGIGGCPISRARYKTDIRYLDATELDRVRDELMNVRLATYRYRAGGPAAPEQLGFIIDDVGVAPSVNPDGETVNLYGYASMAVAALQAQERELAELRSEVASLRMQVEAKATKPAARPGR